MGTELKRGSSVAFLVCVLAFSAVAAAGDLTFYVTDFGIRQYRDGVLSTGDCFRQAKSEVFPSLPQESQILIVMPPHQELAKMSDEEVTRSIAAALTRRADAAIAKNITTFELQMVQHIGPWTYVSTTHQQAVNRFGKCAYEAIGQLHTHLVEKGAQSAVFHGVFGSNGTKVFAENVNAWKAYMKDATLFDGRAFRTAMIETINALGAQNVCVFNTAGDLPAPNFPWIHSIGNHDVVKDLKSSFPGLTVGWIDPLDRVDHVGAGHLAAMVSRPEPVFLVKFWDGHRYSDPAELSSAKLVTKISRGAGLSGKTDGPVQESGVSMQMDVNAESLHDGDAEALDSLKKDVLDKRPDDESLSWAGREEQQQEQEEEEE